MMLKKLIPAFIKQWYYNRNAPKKYGWFGNYPSWKAAESRCSGYDNQAILERVKESVLRVKTGKAVYERDSVLFDEIEYSQPLLDAFSLCASSNQDQLYVVDFGGSLGSSYFQNRSFFSQLKALKWAIVEQKHFVDCGRKFIEEDKLKFYYTIEEALQHQPAHVLFLSSVIQYFEKPYELIGQCIQHGFEYIIVDRTAFIESDQERVTVQIVPDFIYKASYPSWFFNEQKLVDAFSQGYELLSTFDSKFDPREQLDDGAWSYRKGFVFKKIK